MNKTDLDAPLEHDAATLLARLDKDLAGIQLVMAELAKRAAKYRAMQREAQAVVKPPSTDRRVVWQQNKIAEGICAKCGNEPILFARSTRYGKKCLGKLRKAAAARMAGVDKVLEG